MESPSVPLNFPLAFPLSRTLWRVILLLYFGDVFLSHCQGWLVRCLCEHPAWVISVGLTPPQEVPGAGLMVGYVGGRLCGRSAVI